MGISNLLNVKQEVISKGHFRFSGLRYNLDLFWFWTVWFFDMPRLSRFRFLISLVKMYYIRRSFYVTIHKPQFAKNKSPQWQIISKLFFNNVTAQRRWQIRIRPIRPKRLTAVATVARLILIVLGHDDDDDAWWCMMMMMMMMPNPIIRATTMDLISVVVSTMYGTGTAIGNGRVTELPCVRYLQKVTYSTHVCCIHIQHPKSTYFIHSSTVLQKVHSRATDYSTMFLFTASFLWRRHTRRHLPLGKLHCTVRGEIMATDNGSGIRWGRERGRQWRYKEEWY